MWWSWTNFMKNLLIKVQTRSYCPFHIWITDHSILLFYLYRNPRQLIVLPCHSLRHSQSQHVQTFVKVVIVKVAIVKVVICICQSSYTYLSELLWISFWISFATQPIFAPTARNDIRQMNKWYDLSVDMHPNKVN